MHLELSGEVLNENKCVIIISGILSSGSRNGVCGESGALRQPRVCGVSSEEVMYSLITHNVIYCFRGAMFG